MALIVRNADGSIMDLKNLKNKKRKESIRTTKMVRLQIPLIDELHQKNIDLGLPDLNTLITKLIGNTDDA